LIGKVSLNDPLASLGRHHGVANRTLQVTQDIEVELRSWLTGEQEKGGQTTCLSEAHVA
jgi:hypothetical protein